MGRYRQIAGLGSCVVACFCATILTAFVTLFATSTLLRTEIHGRALAASILNILALTALLAFTLLQTCTVQSISAWILRHRWTLAPVVVLPSLLAAIFSIYILAWMQSHSSILIREGRNKHLHALLSASFAMWTLSVLGQAILLTLCILPSSTPSSVTSITSKSRSRETTPQADDQKADRPVRLSVLTSPQHLHSFGSPTRSPGSSPTTKNNVRNSMNNVSQFLRPAGSRTRLIHQYSWGSGMNSSVRSERPISLDTRQEDGFETWEVDSETGEEAFRQSEAKRPLRLETIPGSRPVSPAKALDGPFPVSEPVPAELQLPESPASALFSPPHSPLECPSSSNSPTTRTFPFPGPNRRPSYNNQFDQSHIHPLFRTDSPTPPPAASPGTIITASPFGGRPASPQILATVAAPSRSRPGSARSHVTREGDFAMETERTPTPPMPDSAHLKLTL